MRLYFWIAIRLFLCGAIIGPIMDGFHTFSGTAYYANPWILKMGWWAPLLLGSAAAVIGVSGLFLRKKCGMHLKEPSWNQVLVVFLCFGAIYFASGFLNLDVMPKFVTLALATALVWYVFDQTALGLVLATSAAIMGTFVEIILGYWGLFVYSHPDFLGVHFWLPLLYVSAWVALANMACKLQAVYSRVH